VVLLAHVTLTVALAGVLLVLRRGLLLAALQRAWAASRAAASMVAAAPLTAVAASLQHLAIVARVLRW